MRLYLMQVHFRSYKWISISWTTVNARDGLAPQILVGFFFKGPPKKKCFQNKNTDKKKSLNKHYKRGVAAAQKTENFHK
jgi:hypothetical protein